MEQIAGAVGGIRSNRKEGLQTAFLTVSRPPDVRLIEWLLSPLADRSHHMQRKLG